MGILPLTNEEKIELYRKLSSFSGDLEMENNHHNIQIKENLEKIKKIDATLEILYDECEKLGLSVPLPASRIRKK